MFPIEFPLFFIYSVGAILGIIPPYLWGKNGGDEGIIINQPQLKAFLDLIHHWQIVVILVILGLFLPNPLDVFVFGWGTSTFLDDALFHSYEAYFARKDK